MGKSTGLLLVELDGGLGVREALDARAFRVRSAPTLDAARAALRGERPDVVVVALGASTDAANAAVASLVAGGARVLVVAHSADDRRMTALIKTGASGYLLAEDLDRLPEAIGELLRGGVPMSAAVSRLVLGRARRSSVTMQAVAPASLSEPPITARQREILRHLAQGHSYEDIAAALCLSVNTVRTHVRTLYDRLGASTKVEAVLTAISLGVLDRPAAP